jgi:hypothetical protein
LHIGLRRAWNIIPQLQGEDETVRGRGLSGLTVDYLVSGAKNNDFVELFNTLPVIKNGCFVAHFLPSKEKIRRGLL